MAATLLARTEEVRVEVTGAAAVDEGDWQKLSSARAKAVVDALVGLGVDAKRLTIVERKSPADGDVSRHVQFATVERTKTPNALCELPFRGFRELVWDIPPIYFAKNSAEPQKIAEAQLRGVAVSLHEHPGYEKVEVRGLFSADEKDGPALAKRRAEAVVEGLVKVGVSREMVVMVTTPRTHDEAAPRVGITLLPPAIPREALRPIAPK